MDEDEDDNKVYIADDKFECIIAALNSRGWTRSFEYDCIPRTCRFMFRNLSNIKFPAVLGRFVNHFRNSQHLSNKALLAYHLRGAGCESLQTTTWSAAFEALPTLIGKVLLNGIKCYIVELITTEPSSIASASSQPKSEETPRYECFHEVHQALRMDTEWLKDNIELDKTLNCLLKAVSSYFNGGDIQDLRDSVLESCGDVIRDGTNDIWIVKAVGASCGESIVPVKGLLQLLQEMSQMNFKCVVQKYIEAPLLVRGGRKFDIRQWVLVTNTNPLTIYGFEQCYLRISGKMYSLNTDSLGDRKMHLCNYAVQTSSVTDDRSDNSNFTEDTMMSQEEFDQFLRSTKGVSYHDLIKPFIKEASIKAIAATVDKLERVGKGFEWLGLDFMVTDALDVKLLEVNVSPDISSSTSITKVLVEHAAHDLLVLIFDEDGQRDPPVYTMDDQVWRSSKLYGKFHEVQQPDLCFDEKSKDKNETPPPLQWELWEKSEEKRRSDLMNYTFKKSQLTQVSLTSTINYGPRRKEIADRVMNILGYAPPSSSSSSSSSSTTEKALNNINQTHVAKPHPPRKTNTRISKDDVHASIFMQKLNLDILGDDAKPVSDSDDDEF